MPDTRCACIASLLAATSLSAGQFLDERLTTVPYNTVDAGKVWQMLTSDDVRVIAAGDSFSVGGFFRVPLALTAVIPGIEITAMHHAAGAGGTLPIGFRVLATDYAREANGLRDNTYGLLFEGNQFGGPVTEQYTFPAVSITELFGKDGPEITDDRLGRFQIDNGRIGPGTPGIGLQPNSNDALACRMLYWAPENRAVVYPQLTVAFGGDSVSFDPNTEARGLLHLGQAMDETALPTPGELNAAPEDLVFGITEEDERIDVIIKADAPGLEFENSQLYAHPAGMVAYRVDANTGERRRGMYLSYLADASWQYRGFGSDERGQSWLDKRFDVEQLTHWLDITTIDPEQPVVVMIHLANEFNRSDRHPSIENTIAKFRQASQAVGLDTVHYLFVVPQFHIINDDVGDDARDAFESLREFAFELARTTDDVSAISLYDATSGIYFRGSLNALNWIRTNDYDNFAYGNLVLDTTGDPLFGRLIDVFQLHVNGEEGAAVIADVMAKTLATPVPPDVNHDGVLDIDDFSAFVQAFFNVEAKADANFDGVLNIDDFSAFVQAFFAN
ncbi:MAG: GC-type dockerin domain-anchored protein [Planctomycetota bacterium]